MGRKKGALNKNKKEKPQKEKKPDQKVAWNKNKNNIK